MAGGLKWQHVAVIATFSTFNNFSYHVNTCQWPWEQYSRPDKLPAQMTERGFSFVKFSFSVCKCISLFLCLNLVAVRLGRLIPIK